MPFSTGSDSFSGVSLIEKLISWDIGNLKSPRPGFDWFNWLPHLCMQPLGLWYRSNLAKLSRVATETFQRVVFWFRYVCSSISSGTLHMKRSPRNQLSLLFAHGLTPMEQARSSPRVLIPTCHEVMYSWHRIGIMATRLFPGQYVHTRVHIRMLWVTIATSMFPYWLKPR